MHLRYDKKTIMKEKKIITSGKIIKKTTDFSILTKREPFKPLLSSKKNQAGRSRGRITVRHRGGGAKRKYRMIDFYYLDKINIPAKIESLEYDPNRSAFISLVLYKDGERRYILAPDKLNTNDTIITQENAPLKIGNRTKIKNIPSGYFICNIELTPGSGAKLVRSAGNFAQLLSTEKNYTVIQLPSKEIRKLPSDCYATIGQVSNTDHNKIILGKAGANRHLGIRPTIRGTAMNAVDHPHGGGEGKTPIGLKSPRTPWGKVTKFVRTRGKKKISNKFIMKKRYNNK